MSTDANTTALDTKRRLVLAAGELFAEHGLEGASIRAIAEKASANVAAINYHFGSKENLYLAVLEYVFVERRGRPFESFIPPEGRDAKPQAFANALAALIQERLCGCLLLTDNAWAFRLAMRSLTDGGPALATIVDRYFRPDRKAMMDLIRWSCPRLSEAQAEMWTNTIMAEFVFYILARVPLLQLMGKSEYDPEYLERASRHIAQMACAGLGLPAPRFTSLAKLKTQHAHT